MTEVYEMVPQDEWAALRRLTALSASVTDATGGWTTTIESSVKSVDITLRFERTAPSFRTGFDLERVMGSSPAVLGWAAEKLAAAERELEATRLLVRDLLNQAIDCGYVDLDAGIIDTRPKLTAEQIELARRLTEDA